MLTTREAAAMAMSIRRRMGICELDLTDWVVTTEAATGAYASTAAAAAAAGAEVWAFAAESGYGTVADAERDVTVLMDALGVGPRAVTIVTNKDELPYERTDLVTNSGFLRPIGASLIERLPKTAVIALMYEAWEARDGDVDYAAAAERGIRVIGVDEHHPACGAFDFVGDLVVAAALRRRWPIRGMRFCVMSDNPFGEPVLGALRSMGAEVKLIDPRATAVDAIAACDVAVVAMTPALSTRDRKNLLNPSELSGFVIESGAFGCVRLWGDVDTGRLLAAGVMMEPEGEPRPGHQGISMGDAGFEAVVRLQVAGMGAAFHASHGGSSLRALGQELTWSGA